MIRPATLTILIIVGLTYMTELMSDGGSVIRLGVEVDSWFL
jgi:hypothetical protein